MSDVIEKSKRVTSNFNRLITFSGDTLNDFSKWKEEQIAKGAQVAFDHRNNIYCVGPTMDYEMYLNYLNYLNESYSDWTNYGYFDLGMVPYMMWPSFMNASDILQQMKSVASRSGVNLIAVPSVSLLKQSYSSIGTDYWLFKDELFFLAKWLEKISTNYRFDVKSAHDMTLSKFIKPLAEISRNHRGV